MYSFIFHLPEHRRHGGHADVHHLGCTKLKLTVNGMLTLKYRGIIKMFLKIPFIDTKKIIKKIMSAKQANHMHLSVPERKQLAESAHFNPCQRLVFRADSTHTPSITHPSILRLFACIITCIFGRDRKSYWFSWILSIVFLLVFILLCFLAYITSYTLYPGFVVTIILRYSGHYTLY